MIEFLKENIIFITSSIILVGLFVGVPQLKKIPALNQANANQTPSTVTTNNTTETPQVTVPKNNTNTTKPKIVTPNISSPPLPDTNKTTVIKTPTPISSPVVNTPVQQHWQNNEENDD